MIPKPSEMSIPGITDADMIVDQYRYLLLFRSSRLIGHVVQNFSRGDSDDRICPDLFAVRQPHGDGPMCTDDFHWRTNFFAVRAKFVGIRHISTCGAAIGSAAGRERVCL